MSPERKQLWERIIHLEIENSQFKVQASPTMNLVSRLEDFKIWTLEQAEELYKAQQDIYINIRKWQNEFQGYLKKPFILIIHDLQSHQTSYNRKIERVSALEKVATKMCESCDKIE